MALGRPMFASLSPLLILLLAASAYVNAFDTAANATTDASVNTSVDANTCNGN